MTIKELVETLGLLDEDTLVVIGPGVGQGPSRMLVDVQAQIEGVQIETVILVPSNAMTA